MWQHILLYYAFDTRRFLLQHLILFELWRLNNGTWSTTFILISSWYKMAQIVWSLLRPFSLFVICINLLCILIDFLRFSHQCFGLLMLWTYCSLEISSFGGTPAFATFQDRLVGCFVLIWPALLARVLLSREWSSFFNGYWLLSSRLIELWFFGFCTWLWSLVKITFCFLRFQLHRLSSTTINGDFILVTFLILLWTCNSVVFCILMSCLTVHSIPCSCFLMNLTGFVTIVRFWY